jgi:hypothetical protein
MRVDAFNMTVPNENYVGDAAINKICRRELGCNERHPLGSGERPEDNPAINTRKWPSWD